MADGAGAYPYGDVARALEQLGWMKAEITNHATRADLVQALSDQREFVRNELRAHEQRIEESIRRAFEHAAPGTERLARQAVLEEFDKRDRAELEQEERNRRTPAYKRTIPVWATVILVLVAAGAGQIIMPIIVRIVLNWLNV